MNALGIHLIRSRARAVLVNDAGAVVNAAVVEGSDPRETARQAAREALGNRKVPTVGLAVDLLEGLDVTAENHGLTDLGIIHVVRAGAASVVAEAWSGAAQGARSAVSLWIGETVLAGVLLDGRPWAGAHDLAGSAGWLALNPVDRQDYRKFGSLAAEVSSDGIARRLAWRIQAGDESVVLERAGNLDAITATHVFDAARAGDGVSISVVRDVARFLGMAIANFAAALDPEVLVIAGAITGARDLLLEPIRQECTRRLPAVLAEQFRCEMSPLGENGVAVGAARLAISGTPFPPYPSTGV
jgi:hypothetical protein